MGFHDNDEVKTSNKEHGTWAHVASVSVRACVSVVHKSTCEKFSGDWFNLHSWEMLFVRPT